jgi:hypothetical protein
MDKPIPVSLGSFLREVSNWEWLEFVKAEHDPTYTSNQAMIFGLVRACAMRNLQAIKLATNRLDGKLATPVKIEYPKVYYLFPNASPLKVVDGGEPFTNALPGGYVDAPVTGEIVTTDVEPEPDLVTLSIRQTVTKMAEYPRNTPEQICDAALKVHMFYQGKGPMPRMNPKVKSVIAAHLLTMATNRSIDALTEVFDNIDGKLVETFKLLGEDIFLTSYSIIAPEGAYPNENGVLQLEAFIVQDQWAAKLGKTK